MTSTSKSPGRPRVFVVGTRAQLIKVAPVIVACERRHFHVEVLLTGQHRDTMRDLINEFGIATPPRALVEAKERSSILSLVQWLPRAFLRIRTRLAEIRSESKTYDVLVHGDTLSTLLSAFVGRLCGARVLHLESGLTSRRLLNPFPEEIFRRLVFRLTDVAFCPSPEAATYMREHHHCEVVDTQGNTVVDAVTLSGVMDMQCEPTGSRLLVSIHRFQNIFDGPRLLALIDTIEKLAERFDIYFVLHPATRKRLEVVGLLSRLERVQKLRLLPRLGYRDFMTLARSASCVLTDGGSNQEELAVMGVPTIIMREHTERSDGLGRNAIMENETPDGVLQFLLDGGHESLRTPATPPVTPGPSERIATYLDCEI